MGIVLFLAGNALLAMFWLAPRDPAAGAMPVVAPGDDGMEVGQRVCVGGVAAEHDPAVPSPLDATEKVLWCHAIVNRSKGPRAGKGPPATKTLKAATRFRLVDEHDPARYVLIDGHQLSASMVILDHDPDDVEQQALAETPGSQTNPLMAIVEVFIDMTRSLHAANVKVIRPGDRLWASGRLRQDEDGPSLGRWTMIDNVPPLRRRARQLIVARTAALFGGPVLMIIGLWWMI